MRLLLALALLAVTMLAACSGPPPAPVVAPKAASVPSAIDAGVALKKLPHVRVPANILEYPPVETVVRTDEDGLILMLLDDPYRAEQALHRLPTPDGWQVALAAQLMIQRGEPGEARQEAPLPEMRLDAGVTADGGLAWVSADELPLKASPKGKAKGRDATLLELPFNTPVKVEELTGDIALVTVEVARQVDFATDGAEPSAVVTEAVRGTVDASWLAPAPMDSMALERDARSQPDTESGRGRAVVLWSRVLQLERSEAAREGLLRAAWNARRASWVVRAALARNFVRASRAELAWGCRGESPQAASIAQNGKKPRVPKGPACLTHVDARTTCPFEPKALGPARAQAAAFRTEEGFTEGPLLRLTVDARDSRALLLASSRLSIHDSCAAFEEVELESHAATLRRLKLPLGRKGTLVRVPVPEYQGVEYAVLDAPSERRAVAWMRSRSRYRWTMVGNGQLQVSLQNDDHDFQLEPDATAVTTAMPPQKDCRCDDE